MSLFLPVPLLRLALYAIQYSNCWLVRALQTPARLQVIRSLTVDAIITLHFALEVLL
jgi:hypothetical protein